MKGKYFLFLLVLAFVFPLVSSVECNADLNGTRGYGTGISCTISQSLTLNGSYSVNMNGSVSTSKPILINGSNLIFDMNGTTIFGNSTVNGRGIEITGNNVTVKNGIIYNYTRTINLVSTNNTLIQNMTLSSAQQGVFNDLNYSNITIINSVFRDFPTSRTGIFLQGSPLNVNITNNLFQRNYKSIELYSLRGSNYLVNNSFYNGTQIDGSPFLSDVLIYNSQGFNISNNYFQNGSYWQLRVSANSTAFQIFNNNFTKALKYSIFADNYTNNIDIFNNTISWSNWNGIVTSSNNIHIYNNTISYSNHHGIDHHGSVSTSTPVINNLVEGNFIFNNLGDACIYLENASFNTVRNNICQNSSSTIISITQTSSYNNITSNLLNGTSGDAFNIWVDTRYNLLQGNTLTNIGRYFYWFFKSSNNTIRDNYINFDNIGASYAQYNYSSSASIITNFNNTLSSSEAVYNLTNALIYYNNFTLPCTDINSCDGNINISLAPKNFSYFLDNFNLTEGVTRQFSPLSISASSSTSKTITSQLSQAINATVVVNVAQCSFNAEYKGSAVEEQSCSNNVATFSLTDIPASTSSLTLQYLDINCSSNTNASVVIILAFSALAIVGLTFILIIKFREGEFDVKILIIVFIAIIVGLVLFTETAQLTGSVCSG